MLHFSNNLISNPRIIAAWHLCSIYNITQNIQGPVWTVQIQTRRCLHKLPISRLLWRVIFMTITGKFAFDSSWTNRYLWKNWCKTKTNYCSICLICSLTSAIFPAASPALASTLNSAAIDFLIASKAIVLARFSARIAPSFFRLTTRFSGRANLSCLVLIIFAYITVYESFLLIKLSISLYIHEKRH